MTNLHFVTSKTLLTIYMQQMMVQQQLIDAQQKIIELQEQVDALTPKNPPDTEVFWHIKSKGVLSTDAANSDDINVVRSFRDWNLKLAKDHIRPYVSPKVYGETVNQMTRGLAERLACLETQSDLNQSPKKPKKRKTINSTSNGRPVQLTLLKA